MRRPLLAAAIVLIVWAPAAADPAAEVIRSKVRAAVGYDAFRTLGHGVIISGSGDENGAPGAATLRVHPDGRYAHVTDSKVGLSYGFDGKTRWARMFTGPAFPAELAEGERSWLRYQLLGHRWLAPDGGFGVEPDPAEHRAYRPCLVVRHPTAKAVAGRVYVDPVTWLPTRFTVVHAGGEDVVEVSDWREAGGVKVPGRVGVGRYDGGWELVAVSVAPAPAPVGADPFAPPGVADTTFDPTAPAPVEARAAKGLLFVRPAVNGKPGPWLQVSSQSAATGLTAVAADRLGLPVFGRGRGNGPAGAHVMRFRAADRFALGTAAVAGLILVELPPGMEEIGRQVGVDFGGLLGADVLARVVLEADFSAGAAAVHDPRTYRPPPGLVWEPVRFDRETTYVSGVFEGKHAGLFSFTGPGGELWLAPGAVRGLSLLAGRTGDPFGSGDDLHGFQAAGCEFRTFGRTVRPSPTYFTTAAILPDKYPAALGAFGPALLGPGTVVFDYPNRRIGFAPRP